MYAPHPVEEEEVRKARATGNMLRWTTMQVMEYVLQFSTWMVLKSGTYDGHAEVIEVDKMEEYTRAEYLKSVHDRLRLISSSHDDLCWKA